MHIGSTDDDTKCYCTNSANMPLSSQLAEYCVCISYMYVLCGLVIGVSILASVFTCSHRYISGL